jgi:glucose-1-phosphate adenylyltransferase
MSDIAHKQILCAGANTTVRRCIIDKNARIGSNCKIVNTANVQEANREDEGYVIKDGIVVVIKSSMFPDGTII